MIRLARVRAILFVATGLFIAAGIAGIAITGCGEQDGECELKGCDVYRRATNTGATVLFISYQVNCPGGGGISYSGPAAMSDECEAIGPADTPTRIECAFPEQDVNLVCEDIVRSDELQEVGTLYRTEQNCHDTQGNVCTGQSDD